MTIPKATDVTRTLTAEYNLQKEVLEEIDSYFNAVIIHDLQSQGYCEIDQETLFNYCIPDDLQHKDIHFNIDDILNYFRSMKYSVKTRTVSPRNSYMYTNVIISV